MYKYPLSRVASTFCGARFLIFYFLCVSFSLAANNIEDGGAIASDQTICFGETPDLLTNTILPSGGDDNLSIEYLWMQSVAGSSVWNPILGATAATYQPGPLQQTTSFMRCSRRAGFAAYTGETNVVTITVLSGPLVVITSALPTDAVSGETLNFSALSNLSYAVFTWEFEPGVLVTGSEVSYTFSTGGEKNVTVTATNPFNGCSSSVSIKFIITGPLPVDLIDFTAEVLNDRKVKLRWATAQELDNAGFEIQKSRDGNTFETIGQLSGYGNSELLQSYEYTDDRPIPGQNYYRLKQIDFDGAYTLSDIITVQLKEDKGLPYSLFPNPTSGKTSIRLSEAYQNDIQIMIRNAHNKVVQRQVLPANQHYLDLDVSGLQDGVYSITFWSKDIRSTQLFIKTAL